MLDTKLFMYMLEYSASTRSRSQDYSAEVSFSSNLFFFLGDTSLTSNGSFPSTYSKSIFRILSGLSTEFVNSAFSLLLFEEIDASPFTTSSNETTCFTASILWELCESISKWRTESLAPTRLKEVWKYTLLSCLEKL